MLVSRTAATGQGVFHTRSKLGTFVDEAQQLKAVMWPPWGEFFSFRIPRFLDVGWEVGFGTSILV